MLSEFESYIIIIIITIIVRNNNPLFSHHHPQYHPLQKVDKDAVLRCNNTVSSQDKDYLNPTNDVSVKEKINP